MATNYTKYFLGPEDYTPLVPKGINLPDWFYDVKPVDFYNSYNNQLQVQNNEQALESNQKNVEKQEALEAYQKKQAEAAKDSENLEDTYNRLIDVAEQSGKVEDILKYGEQVQKMKPKEKEPQAFIEGGVSGLLYPDGTMVIKGKLPGKESASRQTKEASTPVTAKKAPAEKESTAKVLINSAIEALLQKGDVESEQRSIPRGIPMRRKQ